MVRSCSRLRYSDKVPSLNTTEDGFGVVSGSDGESGALRGAVEYQEEEGRGKGLGERGGFKDCLCGNGVLGGI